MMSSTACAQNNFAVNNNFRLLGLLLVWKFHIFFFFALILNSIFNPPFILLLMLRDCWFLDIIIMIAIIFMLFLLFLFFNEILSFTAFSTLNSYFYKFLILIDV